MIARAARQQPVHQAARRGVAHDREPAPVDASPDASLRIGELHRAIGNQAVGRLLQRKLVVNQPGDPYEREADRVADAVMRASPPSAPPAVSRAVPAPRALQRACSCGGTCADCRQQEEKLQRKEAAGIAVAGARAAAPPIVHEVLRSPGRPLDARTRAFMEPRFGRSFADVRIHADTRAAESARTLGANAYASGRNIAFATGQYAPRSSRGLRLIAHELAHVVQQSEPNTKASSPVPDVMRDSWTSAVGKKYDEIKKAAYTKLIDELRRLRVRTVKLLRSRVPRLPIGMQSAANSIVDTVDFVIDLFIGLYLILIGLVVGFSEGVVGLLTGIAKLVYGVVKLLTDLVLGVFDNFEHFKDDIDAIATGIRRIPEGLRIIIDNWLDEYKKASPERQAVMGGELIGQVEAFIVTFAFAGAKAGQVPKLTVATQLEVRTVVTTTGATKPVLVVTGTKTFGVAEPAAAAAIAAPTLMSAGSAGGGGGKEPGAAEVKEPEQGPYKDIKDGTKVEAGRPFSQPQKKKIIEANRKRNGGILKSDDPNDPYQILSDPTKSVSPGMGGSPQDRAMAAVDHIVPQAAGGTNSYGNARVISQYYNNLLRAKGLKK